MQHRHGAAEIADHTVTVMGAARRNLWRYWSTIRPTAGMKFSQWHMAPVADDTNLGRLIRWRLSDPRCRKGKSDVRVL